MQLSDLELFVRIAETRNVSQAARELNMLPATASASLQRLEKGMRAGCSNGRRSLRLTPEGEVLLEHCRGALTLLADGEARLNSRSATLSGQLRISAPADVGRQLLLPWLDEFQTRHPNLTLTVHCSDYHSHMIESPVDMAFRYGQLADSGLVSQVLAQNRRVVVASSTYLARNSTPLTLADLARHNCLIHNLNTARTNRWRFTSPAGSDEVVVTGDRVSDDGGIVREWAVRGYGIAYKSAIDVSADLAAGRLVRLFEQFTGAAWPLNVVYPNRTSMSVAGRELMMFVRSKLAAAA
ncbi:LysR family transcriptional regulator [Massilia sp. B-10]|nr:LysR family transcriptional regulator [Massilia sp. B-10]